MYSGALGKVPVTGEKRGSGRSGLLRRRTASRLSNGTAGLLARFGGFVRSISETHFLDRALDSGWETLSITTAIRKTNRFPLEAPFYVEGSAAD
jgi:hypothetical protein